MNRRILFLSVGWIFLLAVAAGAKVRRGDISEEMNGWIEEIDEVVETGVGGKLVLVADMGEIEVKTWDKGSVHVEVEKFADVFTEAEAEKVFGDFQVEISREGKDVSVEIGSKRDRRLRSLHATIEVTVPRKYSVDLETEGGGIEGGGLEGDVVARTSAGGIEIGKIENGSVIVETSAGGISIEGIENGDGIVKTSAGGISVGDVTGNLQVKTSSGGIEIGEVGGALVAKTSAGGIDIDKGGADVLATTSGGGISVKEAKGNVEVATAAGGIDIGPAGGWIKAKTSGGGISIDKAGGAVEAETSAGGIEVDGSGGPVVVKTSSGGIEIEDARGYIEAKTAAGGIEAELAISDPEVDTHCTLETSAGNVTIYLPAKLKATIDAELRIEGRPHRKYEIISDFPIEIDGERGRRITGEGAINGGGDLIKLRTTNGDIEIKKR
mgnify:FL=1